MKTLLDILGRVVAPLVTPFRANEDVHWEALGELADFVIRKEFCDSLILTGTTGEFYALTDEERIRLAPLFAALNQNGRINPIPILRGAIEMVSGIPIGPPRSPQVAASEDELSVIRMVLDKLVRGASAVR